MLGAATAVGVARRHEEPLAQRRNGRGGDPLRKSLVVDEGDVEHAQPAVAARGIQIFAAILHAKTSVVSNGLVTLSLMSRPECVCACCRMPPMLHVLLIVVGKRQRMQRAADDGLRLVALGDFDGRQPAVARRDPAIAADEIDVVRALHQELGHDRVVVVLLGDVAIGAHFGLGRAGGEIASRCIAVGRVRSAANRVRHVGAERDAAQPSAEIVCCCT